MVGFDLRVSSGGRSGLGLRFLSATNVDVFSLSFFFGCLVGFGEGCAFVCCCFGWFVGVGACGSSDGSVGV